MTLCSDEVEYFVADIMLTHTYTQLYEYSQESIPLNNSFYQKIKYKCLGGTRTNESPSPELHQKI